MIHSEHFRKADETYEIWHNKGVAVHIYIKDGEAIIFPTAVDLFNYICDGGDPNIERFYLEERELERLYKEKCFNYYILKQALERAIA